MALAFGAVSDEIGTALLPLLNEFTTWLTSPEGQQTLDEVVAGIKTIITEAAAMVAWVIENKDWLLPMVTAIAGVTTAWNAATTAVNGFKTAAGIATAIGTVGAGTVGALGAVGAGAALGGFQQGQVVGQTANIYSGGSRYEEGGGLFGNAFQENKPTTVVNNISVKTDATPYDIAQAISRANKTTGTNIIRNAPN
jgi:hypothetical protein